MIDRKPDPGEELLHSVLERIGETASLTLRQTLIEAGVWVSIHHYAEVRIKRAGKFITIDKTESGRFEVGP